jgi:iron complex outermembrane receptor protein
VGVVDSGVLHGAQLENGLDEALGRIPGVYAANRFNPSLDQRLVIRGAGARGNFGVRGLKVLIDGIPQTLPDGQSQLTNLDLGFVDRAEVLLGAASALYGNAAGGVIAFSSRVPSHPLAGRVRITGGSFGTWRTSAQVEAANGAWSGGVGLTRFQSEGFRQHSATENNQLSLAVNRTVGSSWVFKGRYFFARSPEAENPGALTLAELAAKTDSAAAANILRGADKSVAQHQLGLTATSVSATGRRFEATVFGLTRDLDNPLATAPPGPGGPTIGTYSQIDRVVGGTRMSGTWPLGGGSSRLVLGADAQIMRDDRTNRRSRAGALVDTLTADQRETVTEIGPFASLHWEPAEPLTITATVRYDRVRFRVADHYLADGVDQSGVRAMGAASGSLGASVVVAEGAALYASVASAFETPTTTELVNQANGTIGFNTELGPQRSGTVEFGVRTTGPVAMTASVYRTRITDALVQAREQDGRAFFENAARLAVRGVELGAQWAPTRAIRLEASYTHTDATFTEYRSRNGAVTDTLDGNQVPGIPRHVLRAVATIHAGAWRLEWDQQIVSRFYADDRNTLPVDGWEAGVSAIRVHTATRLGRTAIRPFASVANLWDRRYVAAATVNGFGGRVYEPAPGRWAYLGVEMGWRSADR